MKPKLNKKFKDMLKLSVRPFPPVRRKQEQKKADGYTGKKTRSRNSANVSEKQHDTSH